MPEKKDEGLKLLKDIRHISHRIEELQEDIDRTYSMLTSTTIKPKDVDVQTSSDPDPLATKMSSIIEYKEQLLEFQSELCRKKKIVLSIIKSMELEEQRMLTIRYIEGLTIEKVAEALNRSSYYHTWELLNKAEEHFCQIYSENY